MNEWKASELERMRRCAWTAHYEQDGEELMADGTEAVHAAASRIEQLERALRAAIEAMEADWEQIDSEWGPLFGGKFGNLEAAIAAGDKSAAAIRAARSALSGDEG